MLRCLVRNPCRSLSRFYSKNPFQVKNLTPGYEKTADLVNQDYRMKDYTNQVFLNMTKFLGTTAVTSASTFGVASVLCNTYSIDSLIVPAVVAWSGAAIGSLYCAYKLDTKFDNPTKRTEYAYMMHGLMGVTIAPSLLMFPQFIPHALVISIGLVAGPVTIALMAPKDYFLSWGVPLSIGLWGLIGIGVSSIGLHLIGLGELAISLHSVDLYGGVALFTVYSAYDTHKLISDFEKDKKDAVGHACNFSLNMINIFVRLLEILSKQQKK